jgi:hypothetical protein
LQSGFSIAQNVYTFLNENVIFSDCHPEDWGASEDGTEQWQGIAREVPIVM